MISRPNHIITDENGRELLEQHKWLFDLKVSDGDIQNFPMGLLEAHWHSELEIFVLLSGRIVVSAGDRMHELKAGDGCFINSDVVHSFSVIGEEPCRYHSFVFSTDLVGGIPGSVFDVKYIRPLLENGTIYIGFERTPEDKAYFEQFDIAYSACVEEKPGYEFQVREALSRILLNVLRKGGINATHGITSIQEMRLKKMLMWIDRHISDKISVADVAGAAGVCVRECQRIFNQYIHYSPVEYIGQKRILNAANKLSDTDIPVTEIAMDCGFVSPSYFTKCFHDTMGCTPREYRDRIKKNGRK